MLCRRSSSKNEDLTLIAAGFRLAPVFGSLQVNLTHGADVGGHFFSGLAVDSCKAHLANESEECLGGVDGVTKAFEFSIDKRSVLFLTSSPALEKSSIWGYKMSVSDAIAGDGSIGNDALESFHAAMADTPASVVALSPQSEQQTSEASLKRCAITAGISRQPPRNTKKKSPVTSGGSILAASDHSTTLVTLRKQVFSRDRDTFNDLGHATILEKSQIHLMEVMSVCHYVKAELDATKEEVTRLKEANRLLRKDKEAEITRCNSLVAANEAESATLRIADDEHRAAATRSWFDQEKTVRIRICRHYPLSMEDGAGIPHESSQTLGCLTC
ncbi:hypothetical protein AALP_AAs52928U000300 [Arabis alpina]|uniref:Uncharacterized protein n=1 Tax=Arabis alpina TaxID=50452 RepID=A0A087G2S0_ARAAL|nr:hypothetical protein AALP_AAs52928U000300 [Arabis alpina]